MHVDYLVDFQNRISVTLVNNLQTRALASGVLLAASLISGCSADLTIPQPQLPVTSACFITAKKVIPVTLELAESYLQRQKGLMARTALEENTGMLFIYQHQQSADYGFWMYKTLLHLDIAYMNSQGVIGNIRNMVPCSSAHAENCPAYPADVEFSQAVEMNKGFFASHLITIGDQLVIGKHGCDMGE